MLFPDYRPRHGRLVCVDSDGCVFDTMEIKHKECFCPATIRVWGLQPVSKYAREAWEYSNLYSRDRGRSRFHEILLVFDLLAERPELAEYGFSLPDVAPLREWVKTAPLLNNEELAKRADEPVLKRALDWSMEMNRRAAEMVENIPPFPGVRESFGLLSGQADIVIVSATPREALEREWSEHGLMESVRLLCSQEDGTKSQCIAALKDCYPSGEILMLGDAPGDQEAAQANGALFYPIRPGEEIASWREFSREGVRRFLDGSFDADYQKELLRRFDARLPGSPPWKKL